MKRTRPLVPLLSVAVIVSLASAALGQRPGLPEARRPGNDDRPAVRDRETPGTRQGPRAGREQREDDATIDGWPEETPQAGREAETRIAPHVWPYPRRWQLGVYAYNTSSGVVVTGVLPGSPAAREGLERGDRIVTVDGYQVGYVAGTFYPLGTELQNRGGSQGRVRLLVQNVRNNRLINLDVQLSEMRDRRPPPRERNRNG